MLALSLSRYRTGPTISPTSTTHIHLVDTGRVQQYHLPLQHTYIHLVDTGRVQQHHLPVQHTYTQ